MWCTLRSIVFPCKPLLWERRWLVACSQGVRVQPLPELAIDAGLAQEELNCYYQEV